MDELTILKIIDESIENAKKGRYRKREAYEKALKLFELKHILSIVGVRRCGKSTLLKELIRHTLKKTKNILYLNLEHPYFNQYKNDVNNLQKIFEIFKKKNKGKSYIFLDEIQFFKDWQVFIKYVYDNTNSKIVITGSNSRLLSSELASLLSGRALTINLYPFSLNESKLQIKEYLTTGGFPEIVLNPKSREILAETYYKNILYQDVIPRFTIKNTAAIENLSYYLISNIGVELSYNTLKNISNLDDKTVKEYMSYLQDANLLYLLHNYDFSLKKLIGNKKKVYLVDPIFTSLSFKTSPDFGRLFENYIYMELRRSGKDIYFSKNGDECDFIIKKGLKIVKAIQACYDLNENNKRREIDGLRAAMKRFNLKSGTIVTMQQNIDLENIKVIPLEKFGINSEYHP